MTGLMKDQQSEYLFDLDKAKIFKNAK